MGIGTPLYMAPEQREMIKKSKGKSRYNYLADIYSLGLVFFELWVGGFSTISEQEEAFTYLRAYSKIPP